MRADSFINYKYHCERYVSQSTVFCFQVDKYAECLETLLP